MKRDAHSREVFPLKKKRFKLPKNWTIFFETVWGVHSTLPPSLPFSFSLSHSDSFPVSLPPCLPMRLPLTTLLLFFSPYFLSYFLPYPSLSPSLSSSLLSFPTSLSPVSISASLSVVLLLRPPPLPSNWVSVCLILSFGFSICCPTIQPVPVDFSVMTTSQLTHVMTVISLDVKMSQMKSSLIKLQAIKDIKTSLKTLVNSKLDWAAVTASIRDFKIWYGEAVVRRQIVKITSGDVMSRVSLRLSRSAP